MPQRKQWGEDKETTRVLRAVLYGWAWVCAFSFFISSSMVRRVWRFGRRSCLGKCVARLSCCAGIDQLAKGISPAVFRQHLE